MPEPIDRPKVRRERPGWMLHPGSRTAWARGCRCFTIPAIVEQGKLEHQAQCPLRKPDPPLTCACSCGCAAPVAESGGVCALCANGSHWTGKQE